MELNQILIIHLFCTFAMTGVIWIVHLLTYPSMRLIPEAIYPQYHQFHTARIGLIVVPLMMIELLSALLLCIYSAHNPLFYFNLFLLALIWFNTFFHSVPAHQKLVQSKHPDYLERLIKLNIIRTLLWSARSIIFIGLLINGKFSILSM